MKKLFKSFAFWGVVISLLTILIQQLGYDSNSIMLIYLNPILNLFSYNEPLFNFMNSGYQVNCKNLLFQSTISIYWYIGSVITLIIYGGAIDLMRFLIKKLLQSSQK